MAFTVRFEGGRRVPAIVCDECHRDIAPTTAEGYALSGVEVGMDQLYAGVAPIAVFPAMLPPHPEGLFPGSLATLVLACSEDCRGSLSARLQEAMEVAGADGVSCRPLGEYLDALREVLVTR